MQPSNIPAAQGAADAPADAIGIPATPDTGEKRRNYNRLVRQARLLSILLEKIEFKISPDAVGANKALISRDLGAKNTVLANGVSDGTCVANIAWSITLKFRKRTIARCAASYLITYDGMKDCTEDAVALFIENVAKTATYAYFRALYAHLDWSANLGSPPLPIVQFKPEI